jgi:DNA-binding MarR family transcriptional regulator/GNAT superfamily N-acetyltransferase
MPSAGPRTWVPSEAPGLQTGRSLTIVRRMGAAAIQQIRSFNRIVAECIGALDDRFLGRGLPLGEARLSWEIGPNGAEVRALRGLLGLDSGYVSRVLRSLEQKGLVLVRTSPDDGRVRQAHLTEAGLAERAELDRRSDVLALRILEPLSVRQRATLVAAVTEVERLLQAVMVRFAIEGAATPDARWCFEQYFAELDARFEAGFNPELSISAEARELTPPAGLLLIARLRNRPIGCCALKLHAGAVAELKRMWIAPTLRGLGLGRRLLHEIERHACQAGVAVLRLETNRTLSEAITLYQRSGYVEVDAFNREPYAHHWFEKRLSGLEQI